MDSNTVGQTPQESLDVDEVLAVMVEQLASIGWQKLGLQPDPFTGKTSRDLDQARSAIDAVAALVPLLQPRLDERDRRQLANLLNDLRANFVNQSGTP